LLILRHRMNSGSEGTTGCGGHRLKRSVYSYI
jgi:hypothetical protein